MQFIAVGIAIGIVAAASAAQGAIVAGSRRQLFIDGRFIESSENITLTMNPPRKAGEVILPEKPWEELSAGWFVTVFDLGDNYRMYYMARSRKFGNVICLAASDDGVHWEKPKLGVVDLGGSKENNAVIRPEATPFIDPTAPPESRWKALVSQGWPDPKRGGFYIWTSPDGIHWTPDDTRVFPLVPDTHNQAFYDTRLNRYVAYIRLWNPLRKVGRVEMDDITKPWPFTPAEKPNHIWGEDKIPVPSTEVPTVFSYDEADPPNSDHYQPAVTQYPWAQDAYFMFPSAYLHFPDPPVGRYSNDGLLDCQMAVSRDGINWTRIDRRPYVALGSAGSNEAKQIYMGIGMIRRGDEIYQYYAGYKYTHGAWSEITDEMVHSGSIYRTVQRLDGFVSADAAWGGGALTTPPITFEGSKLELNINCSAMGTARVELRDADDNPIEGFTLADADIIYGNNVHKIVTWKGNPDVSALAGKPIKLHFKMRAAKLYAFQFLQ